MKKNKLYLFVLLLFVGTSTNVLAFGNSFTCPLGTQASCLDYNDKICSSMSKCVDSNAVCFDSYTCDYAGFICKSEYNDLVSDYNDVLRKYKNISSEYNDLVDNYNEVQYNIENFKDCIFNSTTLEEAKNCYFW